MAPSFPSSMQTIATTNGWASYQLYDISRNRLRLSLQSEMMRVEILRNASKVGKVRKILSCHRRNRRVWLL